MPLTYPIGGSGQMLRLRPDVLRTFNRHRQGWLFGRESGGQLFAGFEDPGTVDVQEATPPRHADVRTRHSFMPDRRAETREIQDRHRCGLHFVGDWHTHPEARPSPSTTDIVSAQAAFLSSSHHLNAFLMVVVGRAPFPDGLFVALCDGSSCHRLQAQPRRRRWMYIGGHSKG